MKFSTIIGLEFFKLRRKWIFAMITFFLSAEIVWTLMATRKYMTGNPDHANWEMIIIMLTSLNALFLPIISAVVVSRICDMEHKGDTWKLLRSASVSIRQVYASKYICASVLMLGAVCLQILAIIAIGLMNKLVDPIPLSMILSFGFGTILTNMAVIAMQQWVSLCYKNQAFSLCLGMVGGFIGMTADFFPSIISRFFVWSYYSGLSPIKLNNTSNIIEPITQSLDLGLLTAITVLAAIFYMAGSSHITRQDI